MPAARRDSGKRSRTAEGFRSHLSQQLELEGFSTLESNTRDCSSVRAEVLREFGTNSVDSEPPLRTTGRSLWRSPIPGPAIFGLPRADLGRPSLILWLRRLSPWRHSFGYLCCWSASGFRSSWRNRRESNLVATSSQSSASVASHATDLPTSLAACGSMVRPLPCAAAIPVPPSRSVTVLEADLCKCSADPLLKGRSCRSAVSASLRNRSS